MCSDNVSRLLYYLLLTSSNDNRYLLLNALIDNLRYYNSHTTYIYLLITTLFDSNDIIAEQITRVLFERLLIPKPLQIGVVVTLFEILNVKNHNLIDKQFLKKQPKLHSLLSNISLN
ncbi:putative CCR4-Not complex component [Entamoeba marina]